MQTHPLHSLTQKKIPFVLVAIASLALLLPSGKAAMVVNIDVNGYSTDTYSGQGGYSTADAHLWNGFDLPGTVYFPPGGSPFSSGTFFDSAGGSTSVVLTLTGVWRTFNYVTGYAPDVSGNALIDDIVYETPSENTDPRGVQFTLSGLTAGSAYSLYLYGAAGLDPQATDFNVGGVVQTTTGRSSATSPTIFTSGVDYTVYSSVTADGSGDITGYFTAGAGSPNGRLSGLQIIAVPEPTTITLLSLGSLALIMRRKFRRRELIA